MKIFRFHPTSHGVMFALAAFMLAPVSMITGASAAGSLPFTFLAAGFTQTLYATALPFAGGVAFASNGDPLVAFGTLYRIDSSTTVTQNGSTIHPTTPHSASLGLGLANSLDGSVYANLPGRGVVKIDPGTGNVVAGPFGAPGNELGIALDPQTHNLVYAGSDGRFYFVSPDFSTQGVFSTQVAYSDGIAFDPNGNFLFTSSGGKLAVLDRNNNLVQQIALANGSCCTDGIAFHSVSPQFVISNNTDGTITRYDFPGNDYTKAPTQALLASGGFRGDLLQVAADGCAYLMQGNTRFADGTVTNNGSLVQLCPGFAPPVSGCPDRVTGLTPPDATGAHVEVRAIEVNQVVQDWCDSVTLIESKPTLVRVHLQFTNGAVSSSVSICLQGSNGGGSLGLLAPANYGPAQPVTACLPSPSPINVTADANTARSDVTRTANFLLPSSWLSGTVTLTAVPAAGQTLACADPTSQPSACSVQRTFQPSPTFHVTFVQGAYPDPSGKGPCIRADVNVINAEIARLYEVYPLAPGNIDATFVAPPPGQACLQAAAGSSSSKIWGGPISWKLDAFNYSGLQLAQNACNSFPTECQAGRYFITVLPMGYDAWNGVSGSSANIPSANTVWYVGSAPPFVDPWFASRYEVGHELMHAMGVPHPGYWIDDTGANRTNLPVDSNGHTTGLCQEESPDTNKYYPTVAVNNSTPYSFNPGIESKYPSANWSSIGTYPNGRAYSLGPMINGANHEIWGMNVDAFIANDLPQRIVVDPHNTFDMMSYCFGTYGPPGPGGGASKFQWITAAEYKSVLSTLNG